MPSDGAALSERAARGIRRSTGLPSLLGAIVLSGLVVSVLAGCTLRDGTIVFGEGSPAGTLIVHDYSEVTRSIGDRCSRSSDAPANFDGVFAESWDRITIARAPATFRDVSAETGAKFGERLLDQTPSYALVVLQLEGDAIAAYQAEDMPLEVHTDSGMFSMTAPGEFTRERGFCVVPSA